MTKRSRPDGNIFTTFGSGEPAMTKRSRLDDPAQISQQCSSCHKFKIPNSFIHPTSGRVGKTCAECIIRKSASTKAGAAAEVEAVLLEHARQLARLNERLTELERGWRSSPSSSPPHHVEPEGAPPQGKWQSQADYLEQMLLRDPHLCAGFSPFADLAEWFELREGDNAVPGDLVEMRDRKISREITGDGVLFVVTTAPFFVGNAPKDAGTYARGRAVVMIGQAPVNVVGDVKSNQVLVPSGRNDGTATSDASATSGIVAMEDAVDGRVTCLVNAGAVVYKAKISVHQRKGDRDEKTELGPSDDDDDDDDEDDCVEDGGDELVQARLKWVGSAVEAATRIGRRARVFAAVKDRKAKLQAAAVLVNFAKRTLTRKRKALLLAAVVRVQALSRGGHLRTTVPAARLLKKLRERTLVSSSSSSFQQRQPVIHVEAPLAAIEMILEDTARLSYRDPDASTPSFAWSSASSSTTDFWTTIETTHRGDLAEAYVCLRELPSDALLAVVADDGIRYTWKASQSPRRGSKLLNGGRAHGSAAKYFRRKKQQTLAIPDDDRRDQDDDDDHEDDDDDDDRTLERASAGVILAAASGAAVSADLAEILATKVQVEVKPSDDHRDLMAAEPATILDVLQDHDGNTVFKVKCQCLDVNTQHVVDCVKTLKPTDLRLRID